MPRVIHVKKARKDYPTYGIKRGDSYYWWKFPYRPRIMSHKSPSRSQLTQSAFYQAMYDAEDALEVAINNFREDHNVEMLAGACEEAASTVEEQRDECEEKRDNMPEQLQDSGSGEILQNRYEECDTIANSLNDAANSIRSIEIPSSVDDDGIDWDGEDFEDEDEKQSKFDEKVDALIEEAVGNAEDIDWSFS